MTATKTKRTADYEKLEPRFRDYVLPPDLELPPEVAKANEAVIRVALERQAADHAQIEAARLAEGAIDFDKAAVREAIEAGESEMHLTAPEKQANRETADFRAAEAERLLSAKSGALIRAIRESESYVADRQADADEAAERLSEALDLLPDLWVRLVEARGRLRPAKRIAAGDWSRFGPVVERGDFSEILRRRLAKANDRREKNGKRDLPDFEQLVADLHFHFAHHVSGRWGEDV